MSRMGHICPGSYPYVLGVSSDYCIWCHGGFFEFKFWLSKWNLQLNMLRQHLIWNYYCSDTISWLLNFWLWISAGLIRQSDLESSSSFWSLFRLLIGLKTKKNQNEVVAAIPLYSDVRSLEEKWEGNGKGISEGSRRVMETGREPEIFLWQRFAGVSRHFE